MTRSSRVPLCLLCLGVLLVPGCLRRAPSPGERQVARAMAEKAVTECRAMENPVERLSLLASLADRANHLHPGAPAISHEKLLHQLHTAFTEAVPADGRPAHGGDTASAVIRQAADLDFDTALQWIEEVKDADLRERITSELVDKLAQRDLDDAERRVQGFQSAIRRAQGKKDLAARLLSTQVDARRAYRLVEEATTLALHLPQTPGEAPPDGSKLMLLQQIAEALQQGDQAHLTAAIAQARQAAAQSPEVLTSLANLVATTQPELALDLLNDAHTADSQAEATNPLGPRPIPPPPGAGLKDVSRRGDYLPEIAEGYLRVAEGLKDTQPQKYDECLSAADDILQETPLRAQQRGALILRLAVAKADADPAEARWLFQQAVEANEQVPSQEDYASGRAEIILDAALLDLADPWELSRSALDHLRTHEWKVAPDEEPPSALDFELFPAAAEAMVTVPLFATGDLVGAREFIQRNCQLGTYEAVCAVWSAVLYVWDPQASLAMVSGVYDALGASACPLRGTLASAALLPSFAQETFVGPMPQRAQAHELCGRAEKLVEGSPGTTDRALGFAVLCALSTFTDHEGAVRLAARAVAECRSVADQKSREELISPVATLIAKASPDAAFGLVDSLGQDDKRASARLDVAEALATTLDGRLVNPN